MILLLLICLIAFALVASSDKPLLMALVLSLAANIALAVRSEGIDALFEVPAAQTTQYPNQTQQHDILAQPVPTTTQESMYGPSYEVWNASRQSYDIYSDPRTNFAPAASYGSAYSGSATYDVDGANTRMARARARDRRCIDGAVTKGADYYKYHFGSELDDTERRVWWGNNEY